jgi:hypothetical protein
LWFGGVSVCRKAAVLGGCDLLDVVVLGLVLLKLGGLGFFEFSFVKQLQGRCVGLRVKSVVAGGEMFGCN